VLTALRSCARICLTRPRLAKTSPRVRVRVRDRDRDRVRDRVRVRDRDRDETESETESESETQTVSRRHSNRSLLLRMLGGGSARGHPPTAL